MKCQVALQRAWRTHIIWRKNSRRHLSENREADTKINRRPVRTDEPPAQQQETDMRILIAEDDQVLADGLLRTLRSAGAAVDHVASGSEADAALMTNNEFDLLILDLGWP